MPFHLVERRAVLREKGSQPGHIDVRGQVDDAQRVSPGRWLKEIAFPELELRRLDVEIANLANLRMNDSLELPSV